MMMLPFEITAAFSSSAQYGEELRVKWSPWQVIPSETSGRPGTSWWADTCRWDLPLPQALALAGTSEVGPPLGVSSVPLGTLDL